MQEIDTGKSKLRFKEPISLEDFGESLEKFERLIQLISGDDYKKVSFKEYTDWLATTDYVEVIDGRQK